MDKLRKLLNEAKSREDQIEIIAEALCEHDFDVEELIDEGVIDVAVSMAADARSWAKSFFRDKPTKRIYELAEISGRSPEEIMNMNYEDKRDLVLKSMRDMMDDQTKDINRGMRGLGM